MTRLLVASALILWSSSAGAQTLSQRGFVDARGVFYPQAAPNDPTHAVGDVLFREEVFLKPSGWIQFAAGLDLRVNSHDQVEDTWRLDFTDRGILRPKAAVRRLSATITAHHFTLDVGKQFIRWGRADVLNPTDRFAPRDYLNVIDSDFLPVIGVRPSVQIGKETFEAVWVPQLTPSRLPLLDQRWTVPPPGLPPLPLEDAGSSFPRGPEYGVRWNHVGARLEAAASYFDGYNHLPNIEAQVPASGAAIELTRVYPALRGYGGDLAIPLPRVTIKGEAEYFTSPSSTNEEYVLYVIELERQTGEWVLVGGYGGEVVTNALPALSFAPDRGIAKSFLGRASYTVDPRRTVVIEGAVRQNAAGFYVKGEYSEIFGQHWRLTFTGVGIAGQEDDFLGQYHHNSHGSVGLRFSF
jgi:hypothetical protein